MIKLKGAQTALMSFGLCFALAGCSNSAVQSIVPPVFESPVKKASDFFKQGKYKEAEVEAMKAVQGRQDYGFACTILSECLSAQDRFQEAELQARQAVRYEPKVANSHIALARALVGIGGFQEAEQEARAALQLPESTTTPTSRAIEHTVLGASLQMQRKLREAQNEYKAAMQLDPKYATGYMASGGLLNYVGRFQEAEPLLTKAVELAPNDAKAVAQLVVAQTNLQEYDKAARTNETLMNLDPKNPLPTVLQANIMFKQGKFPESETEARKAIGINPMFQPAYTVLCNSLDKQEKLKDAEAAGVKAVQLNPQDALGYLALAQTLADEHKWVAAGFTAATASRLAGLHAPVQREIRTLGMRIWANVPHPHFPAGGHPPAKKK